MNKNDGVSQIFLNIIKLGKLKTTIWETEEHNLSSSIRVVDEVLNNNVEILKEFRNKLPQELERDLYNYLGVICFLQNKLKEAINFFTNKNNINSFDSQCNLLECLLLLKSKRGDNSTLIKLNNQGDNEIKKKYYENVYNYIVSSNYNYEEFEKTLTENQEITIEKYVSELKEILINKGKKNYFGEMKMMKFFATIFEEIKRERESNELHKTIFTLYPKTESLDYVKILLKNADMNYFHFHDYNQSIEHLKQALKIASNIKNLNRKEKNKIKAHILSKLICLMIETYMSNKDIDRNVNKLRRVLNEYSDIENWIELDLALRNNILICYENFDEYAKVSSYLETHCNGLKNDDLKYLLISSILYLNFNMKKFDKVRELHDGIKKDLGVLISNNVSLNRYIKMLLLNESVISVENETFFLSKSNYLKKFNLICEDIKENINEIIDNYNHINALDVNFLFNFASANYSYEPAVCEEYLSLTFKILEKNHKKIGFFTTLNIIITYSKTLINNNNLEDALKVVEEFELWFKEEIKNFTDKSTKSTTLLSSLDRKNDMIKFFNIKCDILVKLKQHEKAIQHYEKLEKFFRHLGLQKDIRCAIIVFNIGYCLLIINDYEKAQKYLEQAKSDFDVAHCDNEKIEICDKFLSIIKDKIEIIKE
jgi:tetratricopeptide (TPR) repeat protein